jgi:isopentenyl phosphate kinase
MSSSADTTRLAVFATNVDGVYDRDPSDTSAKLLVKVTGGTAVGSFGSGSGGADVTGRMMGKLARARTVATHCPTLILNGEVKGRLLDALKGKTVPCSRIEA